MMAYLHLIMLRLVVLVAFCQLAAAQTCSDGGIGPCLGTLCGTGYTCLTTAGNICCLNALIIPATTVSTACVDLLNPNTGVSDCTRMASYCNNSAYYTLMTQQCPRTCGRCSVTATTVSSTCVDLKNPNTGVSDCTRMASYCNNSAYYTLMTQQCPRTCGRCSG